MSGENESEAFKIWFSHVMREIELEDFSDRELTLLGWQAALKATPPGTEVVPEGTLELLGKICARFREIEYQHELNQPHIGDGILYEMLEDLNNTLATDRRQNLDQP